LALKKTFILPSDLPLSLWPSATSVNVLTPKDVFNVEIASKDIRKVLAYPLSLISARKQG